MRNKIMPKIRICLPVLSPAVLSAHSLNERAKARDRRVAPEIFEIHSGLDIGMFSYIRFKNWIYLFMFDSCSKAKIPKNIETYFL